MSDEIREQLSALVDGELPRDQVRFLLRRIDGDAQLAQVWTRYQLAGDVLRRQAILPLRADFSAALMQRIEGGPSRVGARLLRWAGGGAIAAAVAVFALVSTRPAVNMPDPAATLATVPPPAAAEVSPIKSVTPAMPLPPMDFTQPASFDKGGFEDVIRLPRYRRDGEAPLMLGPYVLLTVPPAQTADASPQR